ncbi:MAG: peptide chain release factor N(5)-glutamine methyltransferase [Calditrichia bacterium]
MEQWTIKKLLAWSVPYFQEKQIDNPRLNSELLLAKALKLERMDLYLQFDKIVTSAELAEFRTLIKRRLNREPLQYILGRYDFMGLELYVEPGVLIPRPETEVLVEQLLPIIKKKKSPVKILEIGVGSGCIPVALNHFAKKDLEYVGLEVSPEAMEIAQKNFLEHQLDTQKFNIRQVDFLQGFPDELSDKRFDIIVSNPPYVSEEEWLDAQPEVKEFEPKVALVPPDGDPLRFYKKISELLPYLNPDGIIAVEMSYSNRESIKTIFSVNGNNPEIIKDYTGRERVLIMRKNNG